jgi:hypothetical protein
LSANSQIIDLQALYAKWRRRSASAWRPYEETGKCRFRLTEWRNLSG